jgi:hypothetical protein
MDDAHLAFGQQRGVAVRQVIHVRGQQIPAQHTAAFQMFHRRAKPAVGHLASAALKPIEHLAAGLSEHKKFGLRLGEVGAK